MALLLFYLRQARVMLAALLTRRQRNEMARGLARRSRRVVPVAQSGSPRFAAKAPRALSR